MMRGMIAVSFLGSMAMAAVNETQYVDVIHFVNTTSQPDPNGLGCSLCEQAVAAGIDKGTHLCEQACSQAGSLASICKTACDAIGEVCEKLAHEDCPDAVCKKAG